jgi:hypothetical protein
MDRADTNPVSGVIQKEMTWHRLHNHLTALKTETVSYDLDGQPGFEFTRVIERSRDTLGRPSGWQLG